MRLVQAAATAAFMMAKCQMEVSPPQRLALGWGTLYFRALVACCSSATVSSARHF